MSGQEITQWLQNLTNGDEMAAQAIWEEYFSKLVWLARRHLEGLPRRTRDEEDVALSAMGAFFRGAAAGNYPRLNDRNDVWSLLVTITVHKAMMEGYSNEQIARQLRVTVRTVERKLRRIRARWEQ